MGSRLIRDWTGSSKVNKLSVHAERFLTRLIMKVDDFGRYHGDSQLLKSYLFPLFENMTIKKVESYLAECIQHDIVSRYSVKGKEYVEIKMFDQKLKFRRGKFPPPEGTEDVLDKREGYVYLIGSDYSKPVKIGFSANPWARIKEISVNHPEGLSILMTFMTEKVIETKIHRTLKPARVKGEWFMLTKDMVEIFESFSTSGKNHINGEKLIEELRSYYDKLRNYTNNYKEDEVEVDTEDEVDIENEDEGENPSPLSIYKSDHLFKIPELKKKYLGDEILVAAAVKALSLPTERDVGDLLDGFENHLLTEKITEKTESDFRKHFLNWARKKIEHGKYALNSKHNPNSSSTRRVATGGFGKL